MKYDEWYKEYVEPKERQKRPKQPPKVEPATSVPVEIPMPQGADSGYTDVKIPKRSKK